ncbi:putative ribonuclease H-like domain-containing protein [Tanacetum coccineum]
MRPFRCPVTILNTLDHLGKFDGKSDDGFFKEYSINSKAFRVFNTRTRFVEENLHINFLENKPDVAGTGPNWMFDIDTLTMSMNYQLVFVGNQTNSNTGTKENIDAGQAEISAVPSPQYALLPFLTFKSQNPKSLEDEIANDAEKKNGVEDPAKEDDINGPREATNTNSTNRLNTISSPVNTDANSTYRMFTLVSAVDSSYEYLGSSTPVNAATPSNVDYLTDPLMPDLEDTADLEDTGIFGNAYDDEDVGTEADLRNLETTMSVNLIPTTRIHKDHPKEQITGDINSATQTRRMIKMYEEHAMISYINKNKNDERGIVVRNKARLVSQGYTQEEGIDYDEVFAPVARIEAIRLFLAYASFMGFIVYQMDMKSAFLYGTIEDEVDKALYGLHQSPKAWYETLPTYLIENRFRRGIRDKTLFIQKDKGDILLVQVYVDDIIFGSTKKDAGIFISQDKYVANILKKFDFSLVKTSSTPLETNKALIKDEEAEDVDVPSYSKDFTSSCYEEDL